MTLAAPMLVRLNTETRAQHPEADSAWLELMSIDASRSRYLDQLVTTYGFEAPIEAALALTPELAHVIPLRQRARSGALVQDLLTLGLTPSKIARLPQCSQIVPFRDLAEAFGWIYVIERTTLLHDAIRRHLQASLPYVHAWSYLTAYDGVATDRWQELGCALQAVAANPEIGNYIVAAARNAFSCQRAWFAAEPAQQRRLVDA